VVATGQVVRPGRDAGGLGFDLWRRPPLPSPTKGCERSVDDEGMRTVPLRDAPHGGRSPSIEHHRDGPGCRSARVLPSTVHMRNGCVLERSGAPEKLIALGSEAKETSIATGWSGSQVTPDAAIGTWMAAKGPSSASALRPQCHRVPDRGAALSERIAPS